VRERSASGQGFLDAGDTPAFRGVYEAAVGLIGREILTTPGWPVEGVGISMLPWWLSRQAAQSPIFFVAFSLG